MAILTTSQKDCAMVFATNEDAVRHGLRLKADGECNGCRPGRNSFGSFILEVRLDLDDEGLDMNGGTPWTWLADQH